MMKRFKKWLSMTMMLVTLMSSNISAFAAQEISGTTSQSTDVSVTANITSVYSVSLPATIELVPMTVDNVVYYDVDETDSKRFDGPISGYIAEITMGCAGIIAPDETIGISSEAPLYLTNDEGERVFVSNIIPKDRHNVYYLLDPSSSSSPFSEKNKYIYAWTGDDIGTCDFDGINLTNCNYTYKTHYIGIIGDQLGSAGNFSGTLTFNFGKLEGHSGYGFNPYW